MQMLTQTTELTHTLFDIHTRLLDKQDMCAQVCLRDNRASGDRREELCQ